jgi:nucleoside phosphorylase
VEGGWGGFWGGGSAGGVVEVFGVGQIFAVEDVLTSDEVAVEDVAVFDFFIYEVEALVSPTADGDGHGECYGRWAAAGG